MRLTLALLCAILQMISAASVEINPRGVEIKPRVGNEKIQTHNLESKKFIFIQRYLFFNFASVTLVH